MGRPGLAWERTYPALGEQASRLGARARQARVIGETSPFPHLGCQMGKGRVRRHNQGETLVYGASGYRLKAATWAGWSIE
jgi:hypothetical protein